MAEYNSNGKIEVTQNEIKRASFHNTQSTDTNIEIGNKIRDEIFNGNGTAQLKLIRKSIWALNVLRKDTSTQEDITKAEDILTQVEDIDRQIEEMLTQ